MQNILAHIENGNSKDEIGYIVNQTRKYRKKSGKISRYYSHAYMYRDSDGYKKLYVRKNDVGLVRSKIAEVKNNMDQENLNTLKLINTFGTYEVAQNQIWEDLEKNPDKYTYRAKVAIINKYTGVGI